MNKVCLAVATLAGIIMVTTSPAQIRYIFGNTGTLIGLAWLLPLALVAGVFYLAYKQNETMTTPFSRKYQLVGMKGGQAKKKATAQKNKK